MKIQSLAISLLLLLVSCAPIATETPVPTSIPADTATPASTPTQAICNNLAFLTDVTIFDGTAMTPGQEFVKTWKVKNIGSCTWTTGYSLNYAYGEKMGGQTTALTAEVLPNTEVDISVTLTAPTKAGTYSGYWRLNSNNGYPFGTFLTVVIIVQ